VCPEIFLEAGVFGEELRADLILVEDELRAEHLESAGVVSVEASVDPILGCLEAQIDLCQLFLLLIGKLGGRLEVPGDGRIVFAHELVELVASLLIDVGKVRRVKENAFLQSGDLIEELGDPRVVVGVDVILVAFVARIDFAAQCRPGV